MFYIMKHLKNLKDRLKEVLKMRTKKRQLKLRKKVKEAFLFIVLAINFISFVLCGFNKELFVCGYIFLFNSIIIYTYWVINFGMLEEV